MDFLKTKRTIEKKNTNNNPVDRQKSNGFHLHIYPEKVSKQTRGGNEEGANEKIISLLRGTLHGVPESRQQGKAFLPQFIFTIIINRNTQNSFLDNRIS